MERKDDFMKKLWQHHSLVLIAGLLALFLMIPGAAWAADGTPADGAVTPPSVSAPSAAAAPAADDSAAAVLTDPAPSAEPSTTAGPSPTAATVTYQTHIQNIGWQDPVSDGATSGTTGRGLRLEAIRINLSDTTGGSIRYQTHVQNVGWQDAVTDGATSGTEGRSLRLEAIKVELTGSLADQYDLYYRVHVQNYGWLDWAKNGAEAGTTGLGYRLEAIQITLVAKDGTAPGETAVPSMDAGTIRSDTSLTYQSHVQNDGWQAAVSAGSVSGTTGQGKRVEALVANLATPYGKDTITYEAHVQNIGWQGQRTSGQTAGTTGQGLRTEAFRFNLTGATGQLFDIYYHVHVQNVGWMGWAKNGEAAGTSGGGLRVEAIQIVLVPKGGAAPGSTDDAFETFINGQGYHLKDYTAVAQTGASQVVTVVECSDGSRHATVTCWEKSGDSWIPTMASIGWVGANGVGQTHDGHAITPKGGFRLGPDFGLQDNPGAAMSYRQVSNDSYWVGDQSSPYYGTWQEGVNGFNPYYCEHLADYPGPYAFAMVIDYNTVDPVPGMGTGFFFHCANNMPTAGCVSIDTGCMCQMVRALRDGSIMLITDDIGDLPSMPVTDR